MEGPLRVGRSGGHFGFVKNVVCSSVGKVAAGVRLLYIHFRSLYAGNHSTYSLCNTAGRKLYHGTLGVLISTKFCCLQLWVTVISGTWQSSAMFSLIYNFALENKHIC